MIEIKNLVSIILPTHNRSELITRAIKSIQNQTYDNWELIIIDDNSQDATESVVKEYLMDDRIKYYKLKENHGGAFTRNFGMSLVKGEYIAFLDDDDEWFPFKIDKQLEVLKNNSDVCIVSCWHLSIDGKRVTKVHFETEIELNDLMIENWLGSFSFCMTKREYISGISIDNSLKACQDWDLWLKIMIKTGLKSYIFPEYLVNYYVHKNIRISNSFQNVYYSRIKLTRFYFNYINNINHFKLNNLSLKTYILPLTFRNKLKLVSQSNKYLLLNNRNKYFKKIIDNILFYLIPNVSIKLYRVKEQILSIIDHFKN